MMLAEAEARERTALRLLGDRGAGPARLTVAGRLRGRAGPAVAAAWMAGAAAVSPGELAGQPLAAEGG
jgi:hypothetical protein